MREQGFHPSGPSSIFLTLNVYDVSVLQTAYFFPSPLNIATILAYSVSTYISEPAKRSSLIHIISFYIY